MDEKPKEIARRVVTEKGYHAKIDCPELLKGVSTTVTVDHTGTDYRVADRVVTTVWITQEQERND